MLLCKFVHFNQQNCNFLQFQPGIILLKYLHSVSYVSLRKICQTSINKMTNNGAKKIGTHSGVFHCDEVVACNLLKRLPEYRDAEIIRLVCALCI